MASASSWVTMPSSTSAAAYFSRTVGCASIRSTMQRLGVGRLVLLLVAEAPVADEIDDEVVPEPPR